MSSNKLNSQKTIPSKSKIPSDMNISKQNKNDQHSISRINESGTSKQNQKKGIKLKNEQQNQDLASVIFHKEKAITKLQKQLEKEKKDYEKIRSKVENNLNQPQLIKNKPLRPQTASAAMSSKREQNSSAKYLEEIRSQKQKQQHTITSIGSRDKQVNENQKVMKSKRDTDKEKQKYDDGQLNKTLTLTDYEQHQENNFNSKEQIGNNYNGYSPFNNNYRSRDWEDQSVLQQKTKDISHINYTPTDNRSYYTTTSGVKPLATNPYSFSSNRYNILNQNYNSGPVMHNQTIQQALSIQNKQTINDLQGRLDEILHSAKPTEEQSLGKFNKYEKDNHESIEKYRFKNSSDENDQQVPQFLSKENENLEAQQDRNNKFQDNDLDNFEALSKNSQERYHSINNSNRNQLQLQGSIEKRVFTNSDLNQQYSTQSFGIQSKNEQRQNSRHQYELPPTFQESRYKQSYYQSEPTSLKNGKKKVIDSEIQLYELQKEKHETELQQLRLQVKILEKELKDKKQETLQKEIQYKSELNSLQTILGQLERDNKVSELREQETQVLMQQLRIKENEINDLKAFYEEKLKNEQVQFTSQKRIWQKIYQELQEEINILKHELNQYNVQINNESLPTRQADIQYINLVERYNN